MRILHTSDFHLGKTLDGFPRLDEQKKFLDFFVEKAANLDPDLIIIAGDIYDNANPPAIAESYFYYFLKKLSDATNSLTIVIPGNHDSPKRLASIRPLAKSHGVIIYENHDDYFLPLKYKNCQIISCEYGVLKVNVNGKIANIIALPYISEKRLNMSIQDLSKEDASNTRNFQEKFRTIINSKLIHLSQNQYNIFTAHLFTLSSKIDEDKAGYSLGGAYIVDASVLPSQEVDYIALGHIHKYQKIGGTMSKAYYSGSPIHYNKTEVKTENKYFLCVDIDEEKNISLQKIQIPIFKKIEIWYAQSPQDAISMAKEKSDEESFVYLNVKTDTPLSFSDIKQIKALKKDIVEIRPMLTAKQIISTRENMLEKTEEQKFVEFYKDRYKVAPEEKLVKRYLDILLHQN